MCDFAYVLFVVWLFPLVLSGYIYLLIGRGDNEKDQGWMVGYIWLAGWCTENETMGKEMERALNLSFLYGWNMVCKIE